MLCANASQRSLVVDPWKRVFDSKQQSAIDILKSVQFATKWTIWTPRRIFRGGIPHSEGTSALPQNLNVL